MLSSVVDDLALGFSAMAQKDLAWTNSIKENYGLNAGEVL